MNDRTRILVIDDEEHHAQAVAESLEKVGYSCTVATSGAQGGELLEREPFDIVITDLVMADVDGLAILQKAKQEQPDVEVILITGHASVRTCVTAMQQGAFNYITKPLDIEELRALVDKATQRQRLARSNVELRQRLEERFGFEGVVGNSPQMLATIDRLKMIAPSSATVLIQGESGTGKELVSKAIHNNSPRRNKPFVALNCAALSESIIESELFGHEKGAFTGADYQRKGRFEYANGGTLFLDEVGDMPMNTQIKLLRVIEQAEIMRVGSNEPIRVNVRLISATNQDLEDIVEAGTFREDLYYRIKVVTIKLPPLRERREDIPLLVDAFLKELSQTHGKAVRGVTPPVRRVLLNHPWPGNVRQLKNAIESMVVTAKGEWLDLEDLPEGIGPAPSDPSGSGPDAMLGQGLAEIERHYINATLKLVGGNREEAAKVLGIGERTLYRKIKRYDLG